MRLLTALSRLLIFAVVLLNAIFGIPGTSAKEFKPLYSDKENSALEKFRALVNDALESEYTRTDEFLIRWIRDAEFDLEKANQKLRKSVTWKKNNNIDSLNIQDLNSSFPLNHAGFDRTGSPLYAITPGNVNLRKVTLANKLPELRRHMSAITEYGIKHADALRQQGQNVTQWSLIVDLAGFNLRQHFCLACISYYVNFINDYERNYPETRKYLVGINAPKVFERALEIMKPLMSLGTRRGVHVFDHDKVEWMKWFNSIAEPERLVARYGGTHIGWF